MKRKALVIAITTLVAPLTTQADIKLSGTIQAEMGAYQAGKDANFEDNDRVRVSRDNEGSISNSGPNHIALDMEENLGGGLKGYARYRFDFSTAANKQDGLRGNEAWLGLKGENAFIRIGTLVGNYKKLIALVDPFAYTAIQARGTAGGASGGAYNAMAFAGSVLMGDNHSHLVASHSMPVTPTKHYGLANTDPVENALEIGAHFEGFSISLQGVYDETDVMDGAGLLALQYQTPAKDLTLFAAGSFLNFNDTARGAVDDDVDDDDDYNWKVGGQYKIGGATIALQYEDAEIGYMDEDINPDGGQYILGSLDFKVNKQLAIGGWVAGYLSDVEEENRAVRFNGTDHEYLDEDAISFAVGFKYFFSDRTLAFGGYRQADSDNDFRDENAFGVGIRHVF